MPLLETVLLDARDISGLLFLLLLLVALTKLERHRP